MKKKLIYLTISILVITNSYSQEVINDNLDVNGNVTANYYNVDGSKIETVSGNYDPTKISYYFFEGRGLNYNSADDRIYFSMHNNVPMVVDDGGFIGMGLTNPRTTLHIGTSSFNPTNPGLYSLFISNDGIDNNYQVFETATSGGRFVITNACNVGIGTTDPGIYRLNINGKTLAQRYNVTNTNIETISGQYDPTKISYQFYEGRGLNYNLADDCIYFAMNEGVPMAIDNSGKVGIGALPSDMVGNHKLYVNGTILSTEIKVKLKVDWSDYVFEDEYNLKNIYDLENFIKNNKHLPDIPTTRVVKEDGINLGEMDAKLLQKIEELTLYVIDLQKQVDDLKSQLNEQ